MRLVKFLANAGVASRRASEPLIATGRVTVNGERVTDPARDVSESDRVLVDGAPATLPGAGTLAVHAVNKPVGVVSTASDPQGRPTVVSLVRSDRRLYPVGRLDIDTTGLMLLTNDGALAHRLTHPSFEVRKTYRVVVQRGPVTGMQMAKLREGVELEDGRTAPAEARRVGHETFELTIREGRNRQVKRMCEAIGHRVARLERIAFGPLALGDLASGRTRRLSAAEIAELNRAAAGSSARRDRATSRSAPVRRPLR
ncbi:MAG: pseudouridine synthase [Solirubrobacteraceae bacterium]